ncbi:MAG: helix-turn-helix transcriptional regulator [Oscillospiraceae bacterium]|nr:helix-turn-helix transcriptional regulator [Oscillospiraceae bacterium]
MLKKFRKEIGYTQEQVAEYLSVAKQTYQRYEANEREPNVDTLVRLCDLFDCTLDQLVGRDDSPDRNIKPRPEPLYPEGLHRKSMPASVDDLIKLIDGRIMNQLSVEVNNGTINTIGHVVNPE